MPSLERAAGVLDMQLLYVGWIAAAGVGQFAAFFVLFMTDPARAGAYFAAASPEVVVSCLFLLLKLVGVWLIMPLADRDLIALFIGKKNLLLDVGEEGF